MLYVAWVSNPRPAATCVSYVYTTKITQLFRRLGVPVTGIFLHAAREPVLNYVWHPLT